MKRKFYECEVDGCEQVVGIRSTIRTGDKRGLKACPSCKMKYDRKDKNVKNLTIRKKFKEQDKDLDWYFKYHIERCEHSEQSGVSINSPTKANVCHLFDKSRHPGIKHHRLNYVYLTIEEHAQFDTLLYTHQFKRLEEDFENVWRIACGRLAKLLPLCSESQTTFYHKVRDYLYGDGHDFIHSNSKYKKYGLD
jgi:hypothetical protein